MRKVKNRFMARRALRRAREVVILQKKHHVLFKVAHRLLKVLTTRAPWRVSISRVFSKTQQYVSLGLNELGTLRYRPSIMLQYDVAAGWRIFVAGSRYRHRRRRLPITILCRRWKDVTRALFDLLRERNGLRLEVTPTDFRRALGGLLPCVG